MSCDIGLWGLAVMGQNFALNMASHGFSVVVGNRSPAKVTTTVERAKAEGDLPLVGSTDVQDFCSQLSKPRKVVILVQAGKPVDETIAKLTEFMEEGDIIIDGGNEWYPNTVRRSEELKPKGIHFIGMGISGGEEGARNGPSLMPGGPKEAYDAIEPIITKCAAHVGDNEACTGYCGPIGAGNYVKMVHNGIEYGDMQLISEVYDLMRKVLKMSNDEMAKVFEEWNSTELNSYLIEITYKILAKKDETDGTHIVDYVLDKTGMKGTGRWTVQEAAEQSVAAPTIAASLDTRYISARKDERVKAANILEGPIQLPTVDKEQVLTDLKNALYCSKIVSYAQGMNIIRAASDKKEWGVDLAQCALMWRGGCIIRADLLGKIQNAFTTNPDLPNLMVDPAFAAELNSRHMAWRRIVGLGVASGIGCPTLCTSLTYYDQYRRESLPANLVQAQRDFFGGHTYERVDKEGTFHTAWTDAHKDLGDLSGRTAGNV
mmetsp:Transcript_5846/g.9023  ORF Transcript_5846/g.9023 Transcript_5846/m.9023 type:complete len:488 (-) Transcript_5846:236-1699(-)|eukprot:CAMPEP_0195304498 /NCGR_PEP_ID=MMETSP0707-20130614/34549_1 /TAXON_ID=33640 /ORGANISM="Asterionellopsis glacialis, Strain CCMP134" /LENGTH=487 /DNA_ID=CAMNT_0040368323 /DNA_START=122 /DNA_END=1585 /DNA_ORIENTATION=+